MVIYVLTRAFALIVFGLPLIRMPLAIAIKETPELFGWSSY
jgi:hypothetical protein